MTTLNTPQNLAAERGVLAGLCQFGKDGFITVCDIINDECFTNTDNNIVYRCITEILSKSDKVDIPSIIAIGSQMGFTEVIQKKENLEYLRSLFNYPALKENIKENAVILRKLAVARDGQKLTKEIYSKLSNVTGREKLSEIVSMIESPILNFSLGSESDGEKTEKIGTNVQQYIENWANSDNTSQGIPSPWKRYNEAVGGGRRRGGVYLIASRPKCGKSSCCINDAIYVSKTLKIPVLYLDTEMTKDGQLPRIIANLTNMATNDIETGQFSKNGSNFHITKVKEAGRLLEALPLFYRRISGRPFEEVLSIILRFIKENVGVENGRTKDCLVIYDYFKLMDMSSLKDLQEYQAIGFQISALTDFCSQHEIPCSAYVQLNRQDDISQSDRLLWLCSSYAYLQRKTYEELMLDGLQNGNTKFYVTQDQRYGAGLDDGDYINLMFQKDRCIVNEGLLKSELARVKKNNSGFDVIDEDSEQDDLDIFTDEEFDKPAEAYRDDQYRSTKPS